VKVCSADVPRWRHRLHVKLHTANQFGLANYLKKRGPCCRRFFV
jgi:hypothetical protein